MGNAEKPNKLSKFCEFLNSGKSIFTFPGIVKVKALEVISKGDDLILIGPLSLNPLSVPYDSFCYLANVQPEKVEIIKQPKEVKITKGKEPKYLDFSITGTTLLTPNYNIRKSSIDLFCHGLVSPRIFSSAVEDGKVYKLN